MQVHYLRYQDDIILFCKTKRQLLRCRRRMMAVLYERGLSLSRKKSRMGHINEGFHFLGVQYLPTRTEDTIHKIPANDDRVALSIPVFFLSDQGGVRQFLNIKCSGLCTLFHTQEHCVRHVKM